MAGLYIHVPFCASKCAYCDFYSQPVHTFGEGSVFHQYVNAVGREWESRRSELTEPIETIYVGGGTPSLLPASLLERLFRIFEMEAAACREITIEVNPEQVTPDFLKNLADGTPVSRISMGIQSFNDEELRIVGRRHSASQAIRALELLSSSDNLKSYSVDLIYGLPGQTLAGWKSNLAIVEAAHVPHLSAYMLSYEEGTRLNAMRLAGKLAPTDDEILCEMYAELCAVAASSGLEHYEISNFAIAGHRALHNSNYWLDRPYLGLGPGAHSFDGSRRRFNPSRLKQYISHDFTGVPFFETEDESIEDRLNDYIMVRLRTSDGIDQADMEKRFGRSLTDAFLKRSQPYLIEGSLTDRAGKIFIPERSWLVSDAIISDLFE